LYVTSGQYDCISYNSSLITVTVGSIGNLAAVAVSCISSA